MKYIIAIISLLVVGCSTTNKLDPESKLILDRHEVIINALTNYIAYCQDKKICPKPKQEKEGK